MEITAGRIHNLQLQAHAPTEQSVPVTPNADRPIFSTVLHQGTPPSAMPTPQSSVDHATRALTALVENTVSAGTRVDTMLAAARAGKTFSPTQLLALQNEVFRYSQSVEVLSRTTDRLMGGLKQILNTPV
jgi:hypothetical protein